MIRKPETTKKMSTPRKPPGNQAGSRWKVSTAAIASARRPSSPSTRTWVFFAHAPPSGMAPVAVSAVWLVPAAREMADVVSVATLLGPRWFESPLCLV